MIVEGQEDTAWFEMIVEDEKPCSEEQQDEAWVEMIANATAPSSSTARIHRVPPMVKEIQNYEKYYVPKVVSVGPHHFGDKKLELAENLKPIFTMKLLSNDKQTLRNLYEKLGEPNMVQELRKFYEEESTKRLSNKLFTRMMLLDGCFVLYYILNIFGMKFESRQEMQSHPFVFVNQDLLLLENQIPFKVLGEVMNVVNNTECRMLIQMFINGNMLVRGRRHKKKWFESILCVRNDQSSKEEWKLDFNNIDHLLHLLHCCLTKRSEVPTNNSNKKPDRCTFRNVNELVDVGIQFKPSVAGSLAHIEFFRGWWWWFSASVKLPPITVDDSTKPLLLNLIAFEMCSHNAHDSWVTSYVSLLDSLIDHPEDVRTLRKAGVLDNSLGSDAKVAKLFNEIGTELVPNDSAYFEAKNGIQRHYESWRNTLFSQLKHEYVKSPWAFIALLGALMALFLSGCQTYFSVWGPKGECDDLCIFLKMNHHL